MRYSYLVNVVATADGVFLSMQAPFTFAHPPMLIPWERLGSVTKHTGIFGNTSTELTMLVGRFELWVRLPEEALTVCESLRTNARASKDAPAQRV